MHPALRAAVGRFLPDAHRTLLLRACLHDEAAGRDAWTGFMASVEDVPAFLGLGGRGQRRLAPVLTAGLARHGAPAPAELVTRLRTAAFHEELRCREVERVLAALLEALGRTGAPYLLLKGAALGYAAYDEPRLRHSHDVNLLVPPEAPELPADALATAGFRPAPELADYPDEIAFSHPTGLPLVVQSGLFRSASYQVPWSDLFSRGRMTTVAGCPTPTLSAADHLHHVCVHAASTPTSSSLVWAVDAWQLIRHMGRHDWRSLVEVAHCTGSAVPMAVALGYLVRELDALVPEWASDELDQLAVDVTPLQRDMALRMGRTAGRWSRGTRRRSAAVQAKLAWWWLLPSGDYIRASTGALTPGQVLGHRLARPFYWARSSTLRLLARRARRAERRRQGAGPGSPTRGWRAAA
jgi:hypothetical protein